ncbi:MAG: hypothetical protein B2I17_09150 [Thermoplasmatales archaeon B_DKE]|nr:MAG: hypothetical protein B2I17_09150 [Thermoplasmatales archaeon B_DKE]
MADLDKEDETITQLTCTLLHFISSTSLSNITRFLFKPLNNALLLRKKVLEAGIVILFVGIAILILGGVAISGTATLSSHYVAHSRGEFVSTEFNATDRGTIVVFGNGTTGTLGLILASDLPRLNISNIATYAITPSIALGGLQLYSIGAGNYYFVIYGDSIPNYVYAYFPPNLFDELAATILAGFSTFVAGVVISISGIFMTRKQ